MLVRRHASRRDRASDLKRHGGPDCGGVRLHFLKRSGSFAMFAAMRPGQTQCAENSVRAC
jgi:hypothetical protein